MSIKDSETLKQLTSRKHKLSVEITNIKEIIDELIKKRKELITQFKSLDDRIRKLNDKPTTITEHARMRYIERVMGVDMNKIDEAILNDKTLKILEISKNGKIPITDPGFRAVVKNNTVVTIEGESPENNT